MIEPEVSSKQTIPEVNMPSLDDCDSDDLSVKSDEKPKEIKSTDECNNTKKHKCWIFIVVAVLIAVVSLLLYHTESGKSINNEISTNINTTLMKNTKPIHNDEIPVVPPKQNSTNKSNDVTYENGEVNEKNKNNKKITR